MSAAHDDRGPDQQTPSTDVAEAEAEAIAGETSAEEMEDVGLVAPTTDAASSPAPASEPADDARQQDSDAAASPEEDRRRLQQGSGQASPSFGEQQQRVPPTP
jgi:hypothetical protein